MRILMLSPFPPHRDGLHGGAQLIGRQIYEIAGAHTVRLLYFRAPGEPGIEPALAARCESAEAVVRPAPERWTRWPRLLLANLQGRPMWASEWNEVPFRERIRRIIDEWQPDIVHVEFHILGQYRDAFAGIPALLVQHEPGTRATAPVMPRRTAVGSRSKRSSRSPAPNRS